MFCFLKRQRLVLLCIVILFTQVAEVSAKSLFNEDEYVSLVSDQRGLKKGDILTVLIYETATASTSTGTDTNKSLDAGLKASDGTTSINDNLGVSNGFGGGGTSNQTGKLIANVSVTVDAILANGDLMVSGAQFIELNNDSQEIKVSGRVRPQDILSNNTVLSTRLADAKISFTGEGLLANRAKPGIITQLINWLF